VLSTTGETRTLEREPQGANIGMPLALLLGTRRFAATERFEAHITS
jgi:hypothetical protein